MIEDYNSFLTIIGKMIAAVLITLIIGVAYFCIRKDYDDVSEEKETKIMNKYKPFSFTSNHDNVNIEVRYNARSTHRKCRQKSRRTGKY